MPDAGLWMPLQVRKSNVLKDFVHVAGPLGVTHLLVFNRTEVGLNLVGWLDNWAGCMAF